MRNLNKFIRPEYFYLLDYAVIVLFLMYEAAFIVSLFRPILYERYIYTAFFVLSVSILSILVKGGLTNRSKIIFGFCLLFIFLGLGKSFEGLPVGHPLSEAKKTALLKETVDYVTEDRNAHPERRMAIDFAAFSYFDKNNFPSYQKGEVYDTLYVRYLDLLLNEIPDPKSVLRIIINADNIQRTSLLKVYTKSRPDN
jgi:hypothetical protein